MHEAQLGLRQSVTLLGGLAIPLHRLSIVFRHALAIVVHGAQVELRMDVTLLSRFAIPLHRLSIVS